MLAPGHPDVESSPSARPVRCQKQIMAVTRKRGSLIGRGGVDDRHVYRWAPGFTYTASLRDIKIRLAETTGTIRGEVKAQAILRYCWSGLTERGIHRRPEIRWRRPIGELTSCLQRGGNTKGQNDRADRFHRTPYVWLSCGRETITYVYLAQLARGTMA